MRAPAITRRDVRKMLLDRFPEAEELMQLDLELLHLDVHAFHFVTQEAIDRGDVEKVSACFAAAEELYLNGDGDVQNAVAVSFLEHLEFSEPLAMAARERIPDLLRVVMRDLDAYMTALSGDMWTSGKAKRNWPAS